MIVKSLNKYTGKDIITKLFISPEVLIDFPTLQKLKTLLLYKGYKHPVLN